MKRIILTIVMLSFVAAVRADDAKPCQATKDKDMPACCANKMKTSIQAKESCPLAKATCSQAEASSTGCCGDKMKTSTQAKGTCPYAKETCSQTATADMPGCCGDKMKTSIQAEGGCPFAKAACSKSATVKQAVLLSPKAADAKY